MAGIKILCVCQEIFPYLPENNMSALCRRLPQVMQERGNEIRTFMPRYGIINERRNQLHEVIRLSGMNLIIDNNDHQLIIKVASIPAARVQIYFIDNDDYFARKALLVDPATDQHFEDNSDRAIFFARGILETVRKLRWQPDIIHCHSWFSAVVPIYLRNSFADDPLFKNSKIVFTIYDNSFEGEWSENFVGKMIEEGVPKEELELISTLSYQNIIKLVIDNVDGVIIESENISDEIKEYLENSGKKVLCGIEIDEAERFDKYEKFYEELL